MAYTPELSQRSSATLRRIAWALGIPMTQAIERVMEGSVHTVDRNKICVSCKDTTKCEGCAFYSLTTMQVNEQTNPLKSSKPVYEDVYKGMQMRVCLVREGTPDKELNISSPLDVYNLVKTHICSSDKEIFISILLTSKKGLIGVEIVGIGVLDSCLVTPREVFKSAILANAASVIICHYHPSGNTEPSPQDILITRVLKQSGELLCIPVDDHLIIAHDGYKSLRESGLI